MNKKISRAIIIVVFSLFLFNAVGVSGVFADDGPPIEQTSEAMRDAVNSSGSGAKAANAVVDWLANKLGFIVYLFTIKLPSIIMLQEIKMFNWVGPYNGFTTQTQVVNAWGTVRDLANMFFILILLLMSFGTILQVQGYGYRQLLSRLLIMAILINFSKSIVGLLIDFSQIVTLTFLAPVLNALAGNFVVALGLQDIMNIKTSANDTAYTGISFLMAMILGGMMMIIATVIIGVILIMFVMRIVAFWIMIILAPLAFLAHTFPQTDRYYGEWQKNLSNNLILGPGLAFFMWLAFSIVGQGNVSNQFNTNNDATGTINVDDRESYDTAVSKVAATDKMLNFVIAITLLMAGLKFASSSGAAGASMAGKASSNLQKWGSRIGRGATVGLAGGAAMLAYRGTSKEGGIKGGIGQVSGLAGRGMTMLGGTLGIGAMQRAGIGMQTREDQRKQRKEKYFAKRLEGMSQQQQDEFLRSYGEVGLGSREAANIDFKNRLKRGTLTSRFDPQNMTEDQRFAEYGQRDINMISQIDVNARKARAYQEARESFEKSGDRESMELLQRRSAVVHGANTDSLQAIAEKDGHKALANVDWAGASPEAMDYFLSLDSKQQSEIAENMNDAKRDSLMRELEQHKHVLLARRGVTAADMGNRDTLLGKLSLMQAGFANNRTGMTNRGAVGRFPAATHSIVSDYEALAASRIPADQVAAANFLNNYMQSATGKQIARIDFGSRLFNDASGRADAGQLPELLKNVARRAPVAAAASPTGVRVPGGYEAVANNLVANGSIEAALNNNLTRDFVNNADIATYFNTQAANAAAAPGAPATAAMDRRRELARRHLGRARAGFANDNDYAAFVNTLNRRELEQLNSDDLSRINTAGLIAPGKQALVDDIIGHP